MDFTTEYVLYYNEKKYTFPRTISVQEALKLVEQWNRPKIQHVFGKERKCLNCGAWEKVAKLEKSECKQS